MRFIKQNDILEVNQIQLMKMTKVRDIQSTAQRTQIEREGIIIIEINSPLLNITRDFKQSKSVLLVNDGLHLRATDQYYNKTKSSL